MYAGSANGARLAFQELKATMGTDGERAVRCLEKVIDSLLAHYQFEKLLWRALKTTNPTERVYRELKRRTKSMDSLGEQTLNVLLAFSPRSGSSTVGQPPAYTSSASNTWCR